MQFVNGFHFVYSDTPLYVWTCLIRTFELCINLNSQAPNYTRLCQLNLLQLASLGLSLQTKSAAKVLKQFLFFKMHVQKKHSCLTVSMKLYVIAWNILPTKALADLQLSLLIVPHPFPPVLFEATIDFPHIIATYDKLIPQYPRPSAINSCGPVGSCPTRHIANPQLQPSRLAATLSGTKSVKP